MLIFCFFVLVTLIGRKECSEEAVLVLETLLSQMENQSIFDNVIFFFFKFLILP